MSSSRFHHHHNNNNNNRITSTITTTIIIILVTCCTNPAHGFFGEWGPDLAGPWCATRAPGEQCCVGRDDICSVPILKTECYCDIFCNQKAYDCCPDYWGHCHHQVRNNITFTPATTLPPPRSTRPPPQAPCFRDGRIHMPGETIHENCNNCTCVFHEFSGSQFVCTDEVCLVRPEVIRHVNDGPYTWKASNYSQFWGLTLQHGISHRLGTFLLSGHVVDMTPLRVRDDVLPESFDARDKWRGLIHPITDQGDCASSWAHSTTAVASDRLSIETEGSIRPRLSPQNLLSCDLVKQHGCQGGHLDRAWWYLRKRGVVTEDCYPYVSGKTRESGTCLVSRGQMSASCPSGQTWKSGARYKATPPYRIRPLEREIMKEIMDNGPVQATILVHEDFFVYSRGIYRHQDVSTLRGESSAHRQAGFHSVRIVGWGAERSVQGDIIKYWTCANSWGVNWGEDGFFRIVRGSDESRIERYVLGVWGKISGDRELRKVLEENRRRRLRSQRANRQPRHLITGRQRRRRHLHHKHHLQQQQQQQQQQSQQAHRLHPQQHTPLHQMDTARWNTNTNNDQQQLLYKYKNKSKKHKKGKKNNTNKKNKKNKKNKNKKNKYTKHHFSKFYNSVNLQDLESYFPGFKH